MVQTLVMFVCELRQAQAKQHTSQQYSSNYSPEVETEKSIIFKETILWNSLFINWNIAVCFFKDNQGCKFHPIGHFHDGVILL